MWLRGIQGRHVAAFHSGGCARLCTDVRAANARCADHASRQRLAHSRPRRPVSTGRQAKGPMGMSLSVNHGKDHHGCKAHALGKGAHHQRHSDGGKCGLERNEHVLGNQGPALAPLHRQKRQERPARRQAAQSNQQPAAGSRQWVVGCGLWVVGCGLWVVGCGLWVAGCGLRVAGCGLRVAGCGLRVAGCEGKARTVMPSIGHFPLIDRRQHLHTQ